MEEDDYNQWIPDIYRLQSDDIYTYIIGNWIKKGEETKLGYEEKDVFQYFGVVQVKMLTDLKIKNCKQIMEVKGTGISEDLRGNGIISDVYTWLLNNGICLVGGEKQFFGARKLWVKISKSKKFICDILDVRNEKVIEEDIIIRQGDKDEDIDDRIYSMYPDLSKRHLRALLRKS